MRCVCRCSDSTKIKACTLGQLTPLNVGTVSWSRTEGGARGSLLRFLFTMEANDGGRLSRLRRFHESEERKQRFFDGSGVFVEHVFVERMSRAIGTYRKNAVDGCTEKRLCDFGARTAHVRKGEKS